MPSHPRRTTLPPDAPSFGERYQLIRKLGTGGMGAVYQAVDTALEKTVAVKILLPGLSTADTAIRFQQEAKATGRLDHPNIVKVLDFGQTPSGDLFLIMDYVGDSSLEDLIRREKRIPIEKALPIFIQIASGLAHAHKNGILHRDVKPSNIMLSEKQDGNIQLVDFGLAKLESDDSQKLTTTGQHVGSPLYMSPEQASGVDVDMRSDIYSLGCLMYKTLTGKPALQGANYLDTIMMQRDAVPLRLNEIKCGVQFSPEIEDLVAKTLEKDPDDRFQSAEELKHALQALQEVDRLRLALAASFAHNFEEEMNPSAQKKFSIIQRLDSIVAAFEAHRKLLLVCAIVFVSTGYFMFFQLEKLRERTDGKVKDGSVHELWNSASAQVIEDPSQLTNKKHLKRKLNSSDSPARTWDKIPKYSKASARQMMDEIDSTPSMSRFSKDQELRDAILSGKLHKLWNDHSTGGLMRSKLMKQLAPQMESLWSDQSLSVAWSDPIVQEFIQTPKFWHEWKNARRSPQLSKFAKNSNMQMIMVDKRFLRLLDNPKFLSLVNDKRFQNILSSPINMKMMSCMEAYRNQMKNDVADVICPIRDDLGATPGT